MVRNGERKLSFLVGGVQKAGTTALFSYLREHPQLVAPRCKEIHFFDDEDMDWSHPEYGRLLDNFPSVTGGRLLFDATPIYLYWPFALDRIAAYRADMKFVFMFRDPIDRAWSQWRMLASRGREQRPFGVCIRQDSPNLFRHAPHHPERRLRSLVERGLYGQQLRRVWELFPRENVLLLEQQELREQPARVLQQVAAFLHLKPFPNTDKRRIFVGQDMGDPQEADVAFLQGIFAEDIRLFRDMCGFSIDDWRTLQGGAPG